VRNLSDSDADDGFASFSTDGAQITFLSTRGSGELGPLIMNADGSDQRSLASDVTAVLSVVLSGRGDWDLSHAAGGDGALISLRDLNLELYRRDADGDHNLSRSGAIDWFPAWSPDARQIAFASDRDGSQEIYTADPVSGVLTRLTDHAGDDWFPAWTADGDRLIFVSERERPFRGGQIGLHVIDTDALTSGSIPPAPPLEPEDGLEADLNWTADGEAVVFMAYFDGNWEIFRAGRDDSAPVNLTNDPADDLFPIWVP
jgi:TolB protein